MISATHCGCRTAPRGSKSRKNGLMSRMGVPSIASRPWTRTVVFSTLNRNAKSYLFAIVGAEYLLQLLPRGTHDWAKFLRPAEIAAFARRAGLDLVALIGMTYNPLTKVFRLEPDASVNYLAAYRRPGSGVQHAD